MRIQFIGSGSAACTKNFQTSAVLERSGKRMIVDGGGYLPLSLSAAGLKWTDIELFYVSHLHADHVGGVEHAAFCTYFNPAYEGKPELVANSDVIRDAWEHALSAGLRCIQNKQTTLIDFFDVVSVRKNRTFAWSGVEFHIVQSVHVMDRFAVVSSYGLMFTDPDSGLKVFYTGDTQFNPNQIMDFYAEADVIFQDCETSPFRSGVHAHFDEIITLPAEIKRKMFLMHYGDNVVEAANPYDPAWRISSQWMEKAADEGFALWDQQACGFVPRGGVIDLVEWNKRGRHEEGRA